MFLAAPLSGVLAQDIDHWETAVYDSSTWKYFPGTSDPGLLWNTLNYDDTSWPAGRGSIGYGDGDDRTVIQPVLSVFLRKKFTIADLDDIEQVLLHVDYDDGFVAYLNGVEVARGFMGSQTTIPYNSPSSGLHEAFLYQGFPPESYLIKKEKITGLLTEGENILCLRVHNENIGSSDLSAAAFLSFGITNSTTHFGPLPSWFVPPLVFTSSHLPIVSINTNNQSITDETRIVADMGIIYNGIGMLNNVADDPNHYDGKISIEYRGESSQMFPKRSFSIETQDIQGNNLNTDLLGMPMENDWILYAPYTDKTMLRDVLTYKLGNDLGHYAPRTRFVELVLNEEYAGIYVLIEKIKQDKNRVDIATLKPEDVSGDELTGGYILRVDKIDNNDFPAWTTSSVPRLPGENIINFQYYDREGTDLTTSQQNYIRNYVSEAEAALASPSFISTSTGYKKYFDVASAVDFILVNEIGKNIDAFVYSTYLFKDKDSDGGKLHMGPLWDFNLAYGNVDYSSNAQYAPGWMWDEQYRMYWFRRMVSDPGFAKNLKCRWDELRSSFLTDDYFITAIDSMANLLGDAQVRNFRRWPILGTYVWPNQYVGLTYADEINFIKQWIITRLQWMDANMPGVCDLITGTEALHDLELSVYPNPSNDSFTIRIERSSAEAVRIEIHNSIGELVLKKSTSATDFVWNTTDTKGNSLSAGIYIVSVYSGNTLVSQNKITKTK